MEHNTHPTPAPAPHHKEEQAAAAKPQLLILPVSVVSRTDVGRLLREVERVNEFLEQAAIREPGTPVKLPRASRLFDEIVEFNHLNILHPEDRRRLHLFMISIKAKAPVLHMSFSADPSARFTHKLVTYLRKNIHPFVLLEIGLQPTIGAGCIVRTKNKYFDFSLRSDFAAKRDLLIDKIRGEVQPLEATPPPQAGVPQ